MDRQSMINLVNDTFQRWSPTSRVPYFAAGYIAAVTEYDEIVVAEINHRGFAPEAYYVLKPAVCGKYGIGRPAKSGKPIAWRRRTRDWRAVA